jgi:hypothetical protein
VWAAVRICVSQTNKEKESVIGVVMYKNVVDTEFGFIRNLSLAGKLMSDFRT